MERLWREPDFRAKADEDSEFRSHLVGFAYTQRKTSVEEVVNLHYTTAHGDGGPYKGHEGKDINGKQYGKGKLYMFGAHDYCVGHGRERDDTWFPQRDYHPTA